MSTRANYRINGVLLYKHHDGYEQGASVFFNKMLIEGGEISPEAFLKNVEGSSLADELSGDIEFYYELNGEHLNAYSVGWNDGKKTLIFSGLIYIFINKHFKTFEDCTEERQQYINVCNKWLEINGVYYCYDSAKKNYDAKAKELKRVAVFKDDNPNKVRAWNELKKAVDILKHFHDCWQVFYD